MTVTSAAARRAGRRLVIAIDGPAGSGKSTAARAVAHALGVHYLDTGAMYRGLTLQALRGRVDIRDGRALGRLARRTRLEWRDRANGPPALLLDGDDVSRAIHSQRTTHAVSTVSAHPEVRHWMVRQQRAFARARSVVVEGRDIGTVVFPKAPYKFFLIASPIVRAQRRLGDLRGAGVRASLSRVQQDIRRRDAIDSRRAVSPLACARDAVRIDTSSRSPDETLEEILRYIKRR